MTKAIIKSMSDALNTDNAQEALLYLAQQSEANAIRLAKELNESFYNCSSSSISRSTSHLPKVGGQGQQQHYPIPLPASLQQQQQPSSLSSSSSSRMKRYPHNDNSLQTAKACTESILASLTKVASGGSQASSDLRTLETARRQTDTAAKDVKDALSLRQLASFAADALGARQYVDAVRAVSDYEQVHPSERAKIIAGSQSIRTHERTRDVLQRTVLEQYESAVSCGDLKGLSDLTPLLGMLDLAEKGVGLYLNYSQSTLANAMESDLNKSSVQGGQYDDHDEDGSAMAVCSKLAKIFNVAVTHLRHHLPMVAFSLGSADGDAALVQLVHAQVENRAIEIIRNFMGAKRLSTLHSKAKNVADRIEEQYLSGEELEEGVFGGEDGGGFMGMTSGSTSIPDKSSLSLEGMDDCGFKAELGTFMKVNARLDETALLMQHTESYERFIRHAVDEVNKARELRKRQAREEKKRNWMEQLLNEGKDATLEESGTFDMAEMKAQAGQRVQDVLPPQTQLSEVISEVGVYLCGMERALLLGNFQRAFFKISIPDDRNYTPITILKSNRPRNSAGCFALQTILVEECLYAAQQSTLRAFATGHSGTASVAANLCCDVLGRILLQFMSQRSEVSSALLKPGDGLISGQGGLGQAALSVMSTAQKGLSNAAKGRRGVVGSDANNEEERALMKRRIEEGIARSCASLNDLEVAIDYTKRLEEKLMSEMQSTFPPGKKATEQLQQCIKELSTVTDAYKSTSQDAAEHLVAIIMPRVRSIVSECVGQEATSGTSFMTSGTSVVSAIRMSYNLDDEAYEFAQISEGYMTRLCLLLDELLDPLKVHLAPALSDSVLLGIIGGASKRLEAAIKRSQFTTLGALALDSDIRYFINFVKDRVDSEALLSSATLYKTCNPLARLAQISHLMNVDDLEDVLDLISSSKRKNMWDLSLNDAKAFLNLRLDFESRKVNELLHISE
eukprot:CAMPEP_0176502768 /NCGR_PEP_ID=MMETSP0200_2-20121128/14950_1 /TAXON_ID=947934 /ORGANISM="Chaetoceros sp., Strain GSL56" /LENGTH=961 /DNA_ID=CAMNT_0017901903 /DNA_START=37 /DNA_END=2922 /DNA_ORIENTATION=+